MAEDRRISVADAARFLGTPDACRLIKWAWRQGAIRLFGVRPGENEPVVIPANEGRIDFAASHVVTGPFKWFRSVTMAWSDVKRLAQADVELLAQTDIELLAQAADERLAQAARTPASPPTQQAPQSASSGVDTLVAEAPVDDSSALVIAVASELSRLFPDGRPAMQLEELLEYVRKTAGERLGHFEKTTLSRATDI
jgi:hypothetical protein